MNTFDTTTRLAALSLVLAMLACGGGEAAPIAAPPTPTATHASSAGRRAVDPLDLSGPEYQGDHSLPGDPVAGELVYTTTCIACHAADGSGNGGMTGGDFVHDRRRLAKNNETLLRAIREGVPSSPPMPPWGTTLTDTQMRDALSYIRQHFSTPADVPTPAAP